MQKKYITVMLGLLLLLSVLSLPFAFFARGQTTLFKVTLTTPSTNPSRQAWSEIIQQEFINVGIDCQRVIQDWDTIYDRALDPPPEVAGKTFDEGGFDMLFVGYAMDIDPEPSALYHSTQTTLDSPPGQNYYCWENAEADRLLELMKTTVDEDERLGYVQEFQELFMEELPALAIEWDQEVVAFDPTALKAEPFELYHYPAWPRVKNWELNPSTTQTDIVIAQTGPAPSEGLCDAVSTSYYDLTVYDNVFDSLAERDNLETLEMVPALATSWEVADDDKTWTVHLRQGVKWHDGVDFTADDVIFTYASLMDEDLASQTGAWLTTVLGSADNIEKVDDYTLKFYLPEPFAYFVSGVLDGYILPKHVLESVPLDQWRSHTFNTGVGSYTSNGMDWYGPIGTGPYWYAGFDPTTNTNALTRNDDYWNAQALWDAGKFEIVNIIISFIEESDPAITALKNGEVDVLDSQYHLQTKLSSIQEPWGSYVTYDAFGVQELGFNMLHPVVGTGVDTPLGKQDPSRAAEAARYVRQALSYLIPRQNIIDTILGGFGTPAATVSILPLTSGYDPSIQAHPYDVEMAKTLLAQAGYDTGVAPPSKDFLEEYGLYIAVAVVAVIVAVGAVFFLRRRRH